MLLSKIINKSFPLHDQIIEIYTKHLFYSYDLLTFLKTNLSSFYLRWLLLFIFTNLYNLTSKINYFISYINISYSNNQKLISYILNINLSSTNTIINVNNIKGNPKFFYSAGMFNLQKKQKTKQPKAIITILRALLLKFRIYKTKPVAIHFNNLALNHQSYVFKKLKRKIFTKLFINYVFRSHNGCRLKKRKRIKIRTRTKGLEGVTEWFKVTDCKSV